jgi:exodeoxyribonuclease V alpha subunit
MVDLGQWHQLVQAMPEGCRLLMVGDVAQLPPIGFGLVFHLLAGRADITSILTKIHRQTDESGIPMVAAAIRDREMPTFSLYSGIGTGVSFIDVPTSDVQSKVNEIAHELGGFWENDDLMICTALNESGIGVSGINEMFGRQRQNMLKVSEHNYTFPCEAVRGFLGNWFVPGDPVIFLRNDYREGLFNGSMGRVSEIDVHERKVIAVFDGEAKEFKGGELFDLKLAYAITCHKAQGSQARRVIIPMTDTNLLDPTWLYTAVTRAEEQCVLIGEERLLRATLKRLPAHEKRTIGFTGF